MNLATLLADNQKPLSEVVQEFLEPINAAIQSNDINKAEYSLWERWGDLVEAAEQTPHSQQQRLVEFERELQRQPQPFFPDGRAVVFWAGTLDWATQPMLGPVILEESCRFPGRHKTFPSAGTSLLTIPFIPCEVALSNSPAEKAEQDERWANFHAFMAQLTATGLFDVSQPGLWAIRGALEEMETTDGALNAGLMWFIYAADEVKDLALHQQDLTGLSGAEGEGLGKGTKGWKGYNEERWSFWKAKLKEVGEDYQQKGKDTELLDKAYEKLEVAEQNARKPSSGNQLP